MTYFDKVHPSTSPYARLAPSICAYLHGWSVCRSNAGSIACPGKNVMSMDRRYAANAGAIGGHMGRSHAQVGALQNLETKKYPGLYEDRVFFCIKAWQ